MRRTPLLRWRWRHRRGPWKCVHPRNPWRGGRRRRRGLNGKSGRLVRLLFLRKRHDGSLFYWRNEIVSLGRIDVAIHRFAAGNWRRKSCQDEEGIRTTEAEHERPLKIDGGRVNRGLAKIRIFERKTALQPRSQPGFAEPGRFRQQRSLWRSEPIRTRSSYGKGRLSSKTPVSYDES
jgi:hypothetical protein